MKPVDLTLTISQNLPMFPGSPEPNFISWQNIKDDGYNLELLFFSSHTGTHLDAPFHFFQNGIKIDKIPLERLAVNGIIIKIKKGKTIITKNDITDFEKNYFTIPKNSSIIFHTGWSKNISTKRYFSKNPGLSISASNYLASKKINLVGIDSPSIDPDTAKNFPAHRILSKNNILIVENLTNLEKIQSIKSRVIILPLKLKDATGSPVRAIAF